MTEKNPEWQKKEPKTVLHSLRGNSGIVRCRFNQSILLFSTASCPHRLNPLTLGQD